MRPYTLFYLFTILAVFFAGLFNTYAQGDSSKHLRITLTFDGIPANVDIQKAKLKYNKDFAYSLTLDDGADNTYTVAFKFLNGGYIKQTDSTYSGLYYTDGCGNDIPFRGGIAWYSVNREEKDLHINTPGYMTWEQLKEMYAAGWDVFNHSFSHAANGDNIDFKSQVVNNTNYIEDKINFRTQHFVVPSGDIRYVEPAFSNEMVAVYDQASSFPGSGGLRVDTTMNLRKFKLRRKFLEDSRHNTDNISTWIDEVASKVTATEKYWYNDFTHNIIFEPIGGSLMFSTFEHYMNHIYKMYGKGGKDNIWVAPLQEVYEYLAVRDNAVLSTSADNNKIELLIDLSNVPDSLRYYALSLNVNADKNISAVEVWGNPQVTYRGTGNSKLINLQWDTTLVVTSSKNLSITKKDLVNFEVYPNPIAEEGVNIKVMDLKPEEKLTLGFFDQLGRAVYNIELNADATGRINATIPAAGILKRGVYILKAFTQSKAAHSKIIIE